MVSKKKMVQIDKKIGKVLRSLKFWAYLSGFIVFIVLTGIAFYKVSLWYDEHKIVFQSPIIIKLQSPILIQERSPETTIKVKAIKLEGGVDEQGNVEAGMSKGQIAYEAYKTVRFRESSNGKVVGLNKYCVDRGLINEVGYDPQNKFCFQDTTEQVSTLTNWFRNCLDETTIDKCLGKYSNQGYTELGYEVLTK